MSHTRKLAAAGIGVLALSTVVGAGIGPATADPTPGPPPYRTFAAVGSDTTQDVWNALTNGSTAPIKQVASWDSTPLGSSIKTKAAGATFLRPAGSDGLKALSAVWDPNSTHVFPSDTSGHTVTLTHQEVDLARTTSAPSVAGADLAYLPFSRDAVSVAIKPFSVGATPVSFTTAQLAAIYGGPDDNTTGTGVTYSTTTSLPILKGKTLRPLLPSPSYGTRTFFLAAIGVTTGSLASYVEPPTSTLPVNDGRVLTAEGNLIPFSAGQWIAQSNGLATDTTAGVKLAKLNNLAPYKGTAPALKTGALFGSVDSAGKYNVVPTRAVGVFNRDTYNVVPTSFVTGAEPYGVPLVSKLTGSAAGQLGSAASQRTIKKYGFGVLSYYGDSSFYLTGGFVH